MRRRGIVEAIAFDEHFEREGFRLPADGRGPEQSTTSDD